MRKIGLTSSIIFFVAALTLAGVGSFHSRQAQAEEALTQIFDTSNHYLGACGQTDTTTWTQTEDLKVKRFQIWYNWSTDESKVAFALNKDGIEFLTGEVTRTTCDTYQKNWCNGDLDVNQTFPAGSYELKVATAKQCAIPDGNGTVRLYAIQDEFTVTPTPTTKPVSPANKPTITQSPAPTPTPTPKAKISWCGYALPVSGVINIVLAIILFLKRSRVKV